MAGSGRFVCSRKLRSGFCLLCHNDIGREKLAAGITVDIGLAVDGACK